MMFRKLYWVTEQTDSAGTFRATGVYTSIQDLIDEGLRWLDPAGSGFRISLVKLDCKGDVLGAWTSPDFQGLEEKLQEYVTTGEFAIDECQNLRTALGGFMSTAASR